MVNPMCRFLLKFFLSLFLCLNLSAAGEDYDPIAKYYVPGRLFGDT